MRISRLQFIFAFCCTDATLTLMRGLYYNQQVAKVAELVDAPDLGSGAERRVGSSPSFRTRTARKDEYSKDI